jgi:hypothetical protein
MYPVILGWETYAANLNAQIGCTSSNSFLVTRFELLHHSTDHICKSFSVNAVSFWARGHGIILLITHIAVQEYRVHWGTVILTVLRKWKIFRRK